MKKFIVKIQSFSDIITNSSSEIFCTITSENHKKEIYNLLCQLTGNNDDSEMAPAVYLQEDGSMEVWLPYDMYNISEFFRAGLEAILGKGFDKDFKIEYND